MLKYKKQCLEVIEFWETLKEDTIESKTTNVFIVGCDGCLVSLTMDIPNHIAYVSILEKVTEDIMMVNVMSLDSIKQQLKQEKEDGKGKGFWDESEEDNYGEGFFD